MLLLTSRGAAGQDGQRVRGSVRSRAEAGHHSRGRADLPQEAAHSLSGLPQKAADALRGLLEEVGHGGARSRQPAVQVTVVDVDGKQNGVQTWGAAGGREADEAECLLGISYTERDGAERKSDRQSAST